MQDSIDTTLCDRRPICLLPTTTATMSDSDGSLVNFNATSAIMNSVASSTDVASVRFSSVGDAVAIEHDSRMHDSKVEVDRAA